MHSSIDNGKHFDWGRVSKEYGKYRDIYPDEFYKRILDLGLCVKGQKVLDIGTGTGVLPRNMYQYGAIFTGADISKNQIAEARKLSLESGMEIRYVLSPAEKLDFPADSFDVVTASQCHIYFDKNVVIPKIHNILKNYGHFCIIWTSWLPYEDEIACASEDIVLKYNPHWTGAGFRRTELSFNVPESFFTVANSIGYDIMIPFTRESWNGRIRACRGIGASSLSDEEIDEFEREHMEMLNKRPETIDVRHYVSILNFQKK